MRSTLEKLAFNIARVAVRWRDYIYVALVAIQCVIVYWSILGFYLDHSIAAHLNECTSHVDSATQQCVIAFIPINKTTP